MRERERRDRRHALRTRLTGLAAAFLVIGAHGAQSAEGHVQGSFAPTGDMTVARSGAAGAPLADGRVLVAGGVDPTNLNVRVILDSAEIFDPAAGTFSLTGSMTTPRVGAAAAPLPDGGVLVAGGDGIQSTGALKTAEIFDPSTGTFTPTGDMTVPRSLPAAAPLPDGRVLVAGGVYYDSAALLAKRLQSAEIFDPATGTFSPTGSMTVPRSGAAGAPLPHGRALVVGGAFDSPLSAEIFDATTGKFAPTPDMTRVGLSAAGAPLPDGRVLLAGGGPSGQGGLIFDPVTATFASTDYMTTKRYGAAAAPLADGRVLVAGTSLVSFGPKALDATRSAELFSPVLSYRLTGTKLAVSVAVAGKLIVAAAKSGPGASGAAGKSRPSLKPTRKKGGPPRSISLKLTPVGRAKRTLEHRGRLKVRVRLDFVPKPVKGNCVTEVSPCFSSDYAISQIVTLTLKAKKRR
jgi:Kelch motif